MALTGIVDSHLSEGAFEDIRRMVYEETGIKLSQQKKAMIHSRLMKRLKQAGCPAFEQYVKTVKLNPNEREIMFNLLTTNVTKFFRESHHFDFLKEGFLPGFLKNSGRTRPLKVWSAGCSTGQEPYTLALVLDEYFAAMPGRDFRITASDINTEVLKKAAKGIYQWEEVNEIPYEWLKKHFKLGTGPNSGLFKVKDNLRKKVNFKYFNLAVPGGNEKDETLYDIIFCRNVFIYFDQETKANVVKMFYNRLTPGGCLFLGHSESLNINDRRIGQWAIQQHTVYKKEI